jgi:glycosyltransferase involved in cell wall biosynthesis
MFCVAHVDTERSWRGGQQQIFSLIEGLAKKGHKNIAFVRRGRPLAERLREIDCVVEEINPWSEFGFFTAGYIALRLRHHGVQIVHAHSGHAVSLAALATLRNRIPFVLTRRVDFPVASNLLSWWKYNRATKIISISDAVSRILTDSGVPAQKIEKVYSGVDFRRYDDVYPMTRTDMRIPEDSIVIGQVAALAPHKDQKTFLSAMKILHLKYPNVRAILVGNGPLEATLKRQSTALGLDGVVLFVGFKEGALRWLKSFDIFCLSSKEEGLGTSLIDAMALGVPIVATKAG